jgi:hypothetical protein
MKFEIDFSQASTLRGLVWIVVSVVGLIMIAFDRDIDQLLLLGAGVAGGLGLGVKG